MSKQKKIESDVWKMQEESPKKEPPAEPKDQKHLRSRFFKKQKQDDKEIMEKLKNIYEKDGELPDMTSFEKNKRKPALAIVSGLMLLAAIAAATWAGFFIFKPYNKSNGKGINLAIDGPSQIKAGEITEYEFKFKNTEKVAFTSLEARLIIPEEFNITEKSIPQTTEPNIWTLGSQNSGEESVIKIKGYFLGPNEGTSAFQSIATYRPSNFNSDFQAITTKQITLSGSVIEGTLTGPSETAPGDILEYDYKIKNTGTESLEPIEIALEAPTSFILNGADPVATNDRGNLWQIGKLDPNAEKEIKIRGSFSSTARGLVPIALKISLKHNEDSLTHRRDVIETTILAGDLSLDMAINGATRNINSNFGSTLNTTLSYENAGEVTLGNVVLSITISASPSGLIDWSKADLAGGKVSSGTITWTNRELSSLGSINPHSRGTIDLSLPIVSSPPSSGNGNDEIRISGAALIQRVNNQSASRQIQTSPIVVSLNSSLEFNAEARYFDEDGAPLGSGPLPPQKNQTTNLRIFWSLGKVSHTLKNVRVSATLPSKVSWTGRTNTDSGTFSFDESSRTVRWTIPEIDPSSNEIAADFEVSFTPTESDVGNFITLISESTLEARDDQIQTNIVRRLPSLSTDMTHDDGARGKGAVIE